MRKIWDIASKEFWLTFQSPIAYILLCLSLIVFNAFFFVIIDENREATLRDMFVLMEFLFVFMIPLITMRSFAQEKDVGTMEFLMTTPTTQGQIVLGKYLGVLMFLTVMILLTFPYYFIVGHYGDPDRAAMIVGYFGIWLEGAFFTAIGVMTSSWTRSQVLAAMSSYIISLGLYFSVIALKYVDGLVHGFIQYYGVMTHSQNFFSGLVATPDLIYFISGIVLCLIISRISIDNHLWQ